MKVKIGTIKCNDKNTYIIGWYKDVKVVLVVDFTYYLLLSQKQFNVVRDFKYKSCTKLKDHKFLRNKHKSKTDTIYKVDFLCLSDYNKCKYALKDKIATVAPETLFCVDNKISINDWIYCNQGKLY